MSDQKQADSLGMPDLVLMTQKVCEYVEAVKAKRERETVEKFERQQLERKEGLEKLAADALLIEEMEKKKTSARAWEHIYGEEAIKLQEEQRIVREEGEKQFESRRKLSLALVEARHLEWEEAIARDHEMFTMMREDYGDEVFQEWMLWEVLLSSKPFS
ncbi:hypothetical protein Mapa_011746 [Marchantia paleacea]|nr:hypothetical protein Mapa_011746 [Marchantia paleacea]